MSLLHVPFNILDEGFTHGDDPTQPPTVQIEARVAGRFDDERMRQAMRIALGRHPLARARLEPWTDETVTYEWLIDDVPQVDPIGVVDAVSEADVDRIRSELQSHPVSIFESPPLRARLVHREGGDSLMLAIHHAASDGMGALRLLQSVLRAYAGVDDPQPQFDPLEVHRLPVPEFEPSAAQQWHAARMEFERFARMGSNPERLSPQDVTSRAGYGIHSMRMPLDPITRAPLRTELGASVNDLLITAATLACARWIEAHGDTAPNRITVMMPINARPAEWRNEVVGNFVTADVVSTSPEERATARDCLFASPDLFDPERFAPPRSEHRKTPLALVGFGGGPRLCLGQAFSLLEMKIVASILLHGYEWQLETTTPRLRHVPTVHPVGGLPGTVWAR